MAQTSAGSGPIPPAKKDDTEDVAWALSTAEAMYARGDHGDALKWLRRAAEAASESQSDDRALELAKAAADLASVIGPPMSAPPPPPPAPLTAPPQPPPPPTAPPAPAVQTAPFPSQAAPFAPAATPFPQQMQPFAPAITPLPFPAGTAPPVPPAPPLPAPSPPPASVSSAPPTPPVPVPSFTHAPAPPNAMRPVPPASPGAPPRAPTPPPKPGGVPPRVPAGRPVSPFAGAARGSEARRSGRRSRPEITIGRPPDEVTQSMATADIPRPHPPDTTPALRNLAGADETTPAAVQAVAPHDAPPYPDRETRPADLTPIAAPTEEMDAWPTQSLSGEEMDPPDEKTRIGVPAYEVSARLATEASLQSNEPALRPSQAVRVVVWRALDGVHVAPQGTRVSAISVDAVLVALDPTADLASWLSGK